MGVCGAGSIIARENKSQQFDTTLECIHDDHLLLANGKSLILVMNASQPKFSDDKMPVVKGFVGPHLVTALQDTGCSSVVVKRQFAEDNQLTGEHRYMMMADKTVRKVPHAIININTPFYTGKVNAVCLPDALYDLLIGNIEGAREPNNPDKSWKMKTRHYREL